MPGALGMLARARLLPRPLSSPLRRQLPPQRELQVSKQRRERGAAATQQLLLPYPRVDVAARAAAAPAAA
jgi:hypothetical protein